MVKKDGIYKCNICGNIVEVLEAAAADLICCGQPMTLLTEKTEDKGMEKHVPVLSTEANKVTVKVGSVPHPMEEKHYITLIEALGYGQVLASYRPSPGEEPKAEFELSKKEGITARIYCNIHGLWKSK